MSEKTVGERRVRVDFNPSNSGNVNALKTKAAEMINVLEAFRTDERYSHSSDTLRDIALAMTQIKIAAMCSVDAVTGS